MRLKPYQDSVGVWTIGYGHNMEAHGDQIPDFITQEQADQWLQEDIANATNALLNALPWVGGLDDARQGAFINLTFNMGIRKLLGFHHMLNYAQYGQWPEASSALLDSVYAREVGLRAQRLAAQLETGEWT